MCHVYNTCSHLPTGHTLHIDQVVLFNFSRQAHEWRNFLTHIVFVNWMLCRKSCERKKSRRRGEFSSWKEVITRHVIFILPRLLPSNNRPCLFIVPLHMTNFLRSSSSSAMTWHTFSLHSSSSSAMTWQSFFLFFCYDMTDVLFSSNTSFLCDHTTI